MPKDLRPILRRWEFKLPLGTDLREAARRARELSAQHDSLFKLLRKDGALPELLAREQDIRDEVVASVQEAERAFFIRPRGEHELTALHKNRRTLQAAGRADVALWQNAQASELDKKLTSAQRAEHGDGAAILQRRSDSMSRLRIIEAGLELSDEIDEEDDEEALAQFRQERALRREADELRKYIASLDAIIGKPAPRINKPRVGTLSDGVTAIDTARIAANKISESSQGKSAGYRRRFIDMFGDASIREIKRADVDRWIDAVAGLPNVNYLPPKERQASLSALLDMRADLDVPAVDSVVPQRHLDWLRSVLNYGVQKAIIEANVAAGIKVPASSRAYADRRQPFSPTQLREVLNVAERVWKDDTRLWYLRLAVYSGARPDELAQLKYDDFRSEDGIPFADIHDLDGRTIKNASSVRKVPLHPQLISAGILDFIEKRKGKAGDNVWGFERQTQGYHSYATRAFRSNILKLCDSVQRNGEPDKRLVWYGLRHSFADACRNGGVRDDARRALMGHVEQGAAGGYGAGFGLRVLADEIAKADPLKS